MCKVKYGENLINQEDVRNMITGIILRQGQSFDVDTILIQAKQSMKGSSCQMSNEDLRKLVIGNMDVMNRNGVIWGRFGYFRVKTAAMV